METKGLVEASSRDIAGEDYLYPAQRFVNVEVPEASEQALLSRA